MTRPIRGTLEENPNPNSEALLNLSNSESTNRLGDISSESRMSDESILDVILKGYSRFLRIVNGMQLK